MSALPTQHGRLRRLLVLPAWMMAGVLAYLLAVGCWAWTTRDEVMTEVRVLPNAQLTAGQAHILTLVEDPGLFDHAGVSLHPGQGLATISSAVARDVYLSSAALDGDTALEACGHPPPQLTR